MTIVFLNQLNTLTTSLRKQTQLLDILKDASIQRSKLELEDNSKLANNTGISANFEQNRQVQIEN